MKSNTENSASNFFSFQITKKMFEPTYKKKNCEHFVKYFARIQNFENIMLYLVKLCIFVVVNFIIFDKFIVFNNNTRYYNIN